MLVLARQLNERIIIPIVSASIEVVAIKPSEVRLGIEAPPEVTVLREEVLRRGTDPPSAVLALTEADAENLLSRIRHVLRNRLQDVAQGLSVVRRQLGDSGGPEMQTMLQRIETEVSRIDRQMRALLLASPVQESAAEPQVPPANVSPCCLAQVEGGAAI